jgi:hypothetical protein
MGVDRVDEVDRVDRVDGGAIFQFYQDFRKRGSYFSNLSGNCRGAKGLIYRES